MRFPWFLSQNIFLIIVQVMFAFQLSAMYQDTSSYELSAQVEDQINTDTTVLDTIAYHSFDLSYKNNTLWLQSQTLDLHVANFILDGTPLPIKSDTHGTPLDITPTDKGSLHFFQSVDYRHSSLFHISKSNNSVRIQNIPLWMALLPPLIAIALALIFKEVIISLFIGVWSGAFIAGGLRMDGVFYIFKSFAEVVTTYIVGALHDVGHLSVIVFSIMIGGMVAIISKNGGMAGVVLSLAKYAKSPTSTQMITYALGIAIFFDDYANTLIVGNTMRAVTDKYKVSREKLAYIVDSTAAPVSAIAFITTWIGAELGYIQDGLEKIGLADSYTPYGVFLSSLKYSFYPILTLIFMFILIRSKKDYGPMYAAEHRARTSNQLMSDGQKAHDEGNMEDLSPVAGAKLDWKYAVIPVMTVILMTLFGLLETGLQSIRGGLAQNVSNDWASIWALIKDNGAETGFFRKLGIVIGASDSYTALLWSSMSGLIVSILMTISGRIMNLVDSMHWMVSGFKSMIPALLILTFAWALAITTDHLHTADYFSQLLTGRISPFMIPFIIFILAALISFSTGSSWSTMAILYPIAIPTTYAVANASGMDATHTMELLYCTVATVLSASVLGDHCSPISDTTILSSLASDCNHLDHVKTQMPYAITVGSIAILATGITAILGGHWMIMLSAYGISTIVFYGIIQRFGRSTA